MPEGRPLEVADPAARRKNQADVERSLLGPLNTAPGFLLWELGPTPSAPRSDFYRRSRSARLHWREAPVLGLKQGARHGDLKSVCHGQREREHAEGASVGQESGPIYRRQVRSLQCSRRNGGVRQRWPHLLDKRNREP